MRGPSFAVITPLRRHGHPAGRRERRVRQMGEIGSEMKNSARVVVIGAGVAGCGIAYHLAKLGLSDVLILERNEIATGASAYAAGNLPHFAESPLVARLVAESTRLYPELEAETGQATGWMKSGSLRLAQTEEQMTDYRRHAAKARALGIPYEVIGAQQTRALCPLINMDGVIGAVWTPEDGNIDPASVTQAFAKGARDGGVTIRRGVKVTALKQTAGRGWRIETDQGPVEAEIVVNAAGWWARQVSAMVGHHLPMTLHQHQYIVTETIPEIAAMETRVPMLRDMWAPLYTRQEGQGLLCSAYESGPLFMTADMLGDGLADGPLPGDLERSSAALERCIHRIPALGEVGIRAIFNAPVMRSPDSEPLIGPVPGLDNFWVATAFIGGFMYGGVYRYIANWIAGGDPGIDLWPFDLRRFGPQITAAYTAKRIGTRHSASTGIVYPHTEPKAGRPLRAGPLYHRLEAKGAVFGIRGGWEVPLWFAPEGTEAADKPAFGRTNWHGPVGEECRAVRDAAGLADAGFFAQFEIRGSGARAALNRLSANRVPVGTGRFFGSLFLTEAGGVAGLASTVFLDEDRIQLSALGQAEAYLEDHLRRRIGDAANLVNLSSGWGCLWLAGPAARAVLAAAAPDRDWSAQAFPMGTAQETQIDLVPARVVAAGTTGEVGFQIHHSAEFSVALYRLLMDAGVGLGLRDIGLRAFNALRMEKGSAEWGVDFSPQTHASESRVEALIDREKTGFVGHDALSTGHRTGKRLVYLAVEGTETDCAGLELVCRDGEPVGLVTSGGYGHRTGSSLAFARIDGSAAAAGTALTVEILGEDYPARILDEPRYDPRGTRLKI
jgi:dimethylglycine dehydrogenase